MFCLHAYVYVPHAYLYLGVESEMFVSHRVEWFGNRTHGSPARSVIALHLWGISPAPLILFLMAEWTALSLYAIFSYFILLL